MFIDAMGLILADTKRISLGELSKPRALAAVPFGGRYRIIDFMLSGLVNSGVKSVGVIAQNKYMSLMDHLGTGAPWDLDRKKYGLRLLPPHVNSEFSDSGASDELLGLWHFVQLNPHKYVIIAQANMIYNMSFNEVVDDHEKTGADITVVYNRDGVKYGSPTYIFEVDRKGCVQEMLLDPDKISSNRTCMGIMVLRRDLMLEILSEAIAREEKVFDMRLFIRPSESLKIKAFEYKGLSFRIQNIQSYFNASMALLTDKVRDELFVNGMPIYTKIKDEAPTLYTAHSSVSNSLLSDGCRIMGSITDSVLFRGITSARNSKLKNCVIMQNAHISENCDLENVIVDKDVIVRPGTKLVGHKHHPIVIEKGAIV